jgi:hypothetical protein
MVEQSNLGVKKTLEEMDVPRSSFYEWYKRYQEEGYEGLRINRYFVPRPHHRILRPFRSLMAVFSTRA